MITIPINTNYRYKFPVIDQDTGKFITGITIAYSIVKTSDGTVLDSGNCSEIGATGIYYFDYTYAVAQEYDVVITTPAGYFDGFETVMVENAVDVSSSLTAYGVAKTTDIPDITGLATKTDIENIDIPIVDLSDVAKTTELKPACAEALQEENIATLESTGAQIAAFK